MRQIGDGDRRKLLPGLRRAPDDRPVAAKRPRMEPDAGAWLEYRAGTGASVQRPAMDRGGMVYPGYPGLHRAAAGLPASRGVRAECGAGGSDRADVDCAMDPQAGLIPRDGAVAGAK